MGNTAFKNLLKPQKNKEAAPSDSSEQKKGAAGGGMKPKVYTDLSVCKTLGIRRRHLAEARTKLGRGKDWDAVNDEVGMTEGWVQRYALKNHLVPDFINYPLEEVTGEYVSCRLVGTTQSHNKVIVELEASGKRDFVRVRNVLQYPIHYREVFTAARIELDADKHLEWVFKPNDVRY